MVSWTALSRHSSCNGVYASAEGFKFHDARAFTFDNTAMSGAKRQRCFGYELQSCKFDICALASLEFTFRIADCRGVWIAPLWFSPVTWVQPQCTSGEIDLLESCNPNGGDRLQTSFGCGSLRVLPGVHPELEDDAEYDFRVTVEHAEQLNLKFWVKKHSDSEWTYRGARNNYGETTGWKHAAEDAFRYTLRADVWNGGGGDGGWAGCGHPGSTVPCRYSVSNIKFEEVAGMQLFADGVCAATFMSPAEPVPPSPVPPGPSGPVPPRPSGPAGPSEPSEGGLMKLLRELWLQHQPVVIVVLVVLGVLLFKSGDSGDN